MAKHTQGPGPVDGVDAWRSLDDILHSAGEVMARREPGEYTHREIANKYGWGLQKATRTMERLLAQGHVTRRLASGQNGHAWVYRWPNKK